MRVRQINPARFPPASLLTAAGVLILAAWPLVFREADLFYQVLGLACLYATLALAWNIYALSGAISLGHAAFFGLGAYGSALLNHYWHLSTLLTIPLGALASLIFAVFWSWGFRRLRGVYLGLASLAAVEIPKTIAANWDRLTCGSMGIVGLDRLPHLALGGLDADFGTNLKAQYYLLLAVMLVVALVHLESMRSRWGWTLRSIRENETAAAAIGLAVNRERTKALLLSSYLAGIAGAFYAHILGLIEPVLVFNIHLSALPLVFSIFGGRTQAFGPILGALILYPLEQLLLQPLFPTSHSAIYGLVIILTIFFFPQGIAAWLPASPKSA
ncbi:MAG: branched-chain amino acid ABC transporter permease [Thermodesulfobacteriota bacterium]